MLFGLLDRQARGSPSHVPLTDEEIAQVLEDAFRTKVRAYSAGAYEKDLEIQITITRSFTWRGVWSFSFRKVDVVFCVRHPAAWNESVLRELDAHGSCSLRKIIQDKELDIWVSPQFKAKDTPGKKEEKE